MMTPSVLGHDRVMSPETAWARVASSSKEQPGRRFAAVYQRGVLSGIVVGGWESQPQGEGPDGSTPPAKETRAGHAGSEHTSQPHCRAIQLGLVTGNCEGSRECEYNRGTGCGKTARPGLRRGRRVIGVPTAEA